MPPRHGDEGLDELNRRLAELEAGHRKAPPIIDRFVSRLGEIEIAAGFLLFLFSPLEWLSAVLTIVGGATWTYERLIKEPRLARDELERSRQIDMIRSEIDRLTRL